MRFKLRMQVWCARWSAQTVTFFDSELPFVKLHADYVNICRGSVHILLIQLIISILHWKGLEDNFCCALSFFLHLHKYLQVSYRLFELTNTLKSAFVPTKDNKRLGHNLVAAVVIASILYTLSFVLLRVPQMLVSVP